MAMEEKEAGKQTLNLSRRYTILYFTCYLYQQNVDTSFDDFISE